MLIIFQKHYWTSANRLGAVELTNMTPPSVQFSLPPISPEKGIFLLTFIGDLEISVQRIYYTRGQVYHKKNDLSDEKNYNL